MECRAAACLKIRLIPHGRQDRRRNGRWQASLPKEGADAAGMSA
jgi:hypothetical protein